MYETVIVGLMLMIGIGLSAQLVSCALVTWRFWRPVHVKAVPPMRALTILRPVCGLEPGLEETLASSFGACGKNHEVIFCVADAADPALPLIRRLMAKHTEVSTKLRVGNDEVSSNPKLNNLVKGWKAAKHDWIVMIDSNVLLPPDYVRVLLSTWKDDTGLVTSPPIGIRPEGLWAELECAILNGYQARWQLTGDELSRGFAQGKVLFWRRDILDAAGGPAALGHELGEDVASTKIVRCSGCKVRLVHSPFRQPLYRRRLGEVWQRQVRWARVRRAGFPWLFALELLTGGLLPLVGAAWLAALHVVPASAFIALVAMWYGMELVVSVSAGWPVKASSILIWVMRDLLIPAVWVAAYGSRGFVWRNNHVEPRDKPIVPAQ